MRVLHLIDNLKVGGAQEILLNLVRYRALDVEHIVASLYGPAEFDREICSAGGEVVVLSCGRSKVLGAMFEFARLVRRLKPDIVNLHLEYATLVGLLLQPFCPGPRWVVTLHALKSQLPGWFYPLLKSLHQRGEGFVVEDRIAFEELLRINILPERIAHIPIGTDYLDRLKLCPQPLRGIRAEFAIPVEAPVVLNVARMHPAKGQDHLLRAFARVVKVLPEARLVIVGYGSEAEQLKALARELSIEDCVVFPGLRRDLENFYDDADLFVMSALDEGMGVVIYQAMSFGLPVVAYAAGSIAEVVEDGKSGLLIQVGNETALSDAIEYVIRMGKVGRDGLGGRGRELVAQSFSATAMANAYERFYSRIIYPI